MSVLEIAAIHISGPYVSSATQREAMRARLREPHSAFYVPVYQPLADALTEAGYEVVGLVIDTFTYLRVECDGVEYRFYWGGNTEWIVDRVAPGEYDDTPEEAMSAPSDMPVTEIVRKFSKI